MIELEGLNYWAIALAWAVNMAVGATWYSPAGFAKQWKRYTDIDLMKIPEKQASRIISFVSASALIQAVTLALILNSMGVETVAEGLLAGLLLWLGLVAATTVGVTLYSLRSWKFWWLNSSYFLVVMAINSAVLAFWR